jgi:integrase
MSRPRGTGRIYNQKLSSILWIQYYRDGKMHRESTGTADKRKATRILSRRPAEISTASFTAPDVARIRISELAEDFLRDYRINGRTSIDDAEARWRLHIETFFGSLRVSAVTSDLLDRYVDRRQQQGAKNATINRELAALKRMFHLGHDATPPKLFYIPRFPSLTENNSRQGFLEDSQYEKLLESCLEIWFQTLVELGCTYGWRVGELLKLRVNQIDLLACGSAKSRTPLGASFLRLPCFSLRHSFLLGRLPTVFQLLQCVLNLRMRNDGIAFEDAPRSPAADCHNDALGYSGTAKIASRSSS